MEEFVGNFYTYDSAGYLVENDDDEGQNEIDFDKVDITKDVLLKKIQEWNIMRMKARMVGKISN